MEGLRVLHLEDDDADGDLVVRSLRRADLDAEIRRVGTRAEFVAAIESQRFDLVLSDFSLPDFDGLTALALFREKDRHTPFIFISGTIGEERAVDALRRGATDYILKDRLSRLPAALRRALDEQRERRARQQAEEQIREQAALLDNAREAIVIKDLDRRITYWNRGAEKLYGWTAAEAKAGEAEARFGTDDRPGLDAAWKACLEYGSWDGCLRQYTRAGQEIVVEAHWTCLRHDDGGLKGVMSIGSDVTRARDLELQLMRAQRLETVGMIAGGVAHDLNNVLAPILIGIESLKRRVTEDSGRRLLANMEAGVERGADIVRQVLTFSRGAGAPAQDVDVREMIHGIERLVIAALPRTVKLTADMPEDLWHVPGDVTQLQQVMLNLCINARDAMPKGGRLTVRAENVTLDGPRHGDHVKITVADTGEGMAPEVRRRVFEPFYTTKEKGTGIGLSTAASIILRHGGFVELDSEPGQGTEFRLFLPVAPQRSALTREGVRRAAGTLLVVEEGAIRGIVSTTLEAYGYRVLGAETAADARGLLERNAGGIDAILVNTSIPNLDGVALIRDAARAEPRAKLIQTSGLADSPALQGLEGVVHASLPKPYTAEALLATVARVLETA